jgi:hypothetical protein
MPDNIRMHFGPIANDMQLCVRKPRNNEFFEGLKGKAATLAAIDKDEHRNWRLLTRLKLAQKAQYRFPTAIERVASRTDKPSSG